LNSCFRGRYEGIVIYQKILQESATRGYSKGSSKGVHWEVEGWQEGGGVASAEPSARLRLTRQLKGSLKLIGSLEELGEALC